jgi:cytochrome P450
METSANALEWAMSELLRHPHAMKRLQEEIESVVGQHGKVNESDLASMVYLQCVVKETLRLYPSLPLALPHASVEAVTVGGYYIPKKTMVIMNLWAIGRDPIVWGADASEFKPERFLQGGRTWYGFIRRSIRLQNASVRGRKEKMPRICHGYSYG